LVMVTGWVNTVVPEAKVTPYAAVEVKVGEVAYWPAGQVTGDPHTGLHDTALWVPGFRGAVSELKGSAVAVW
jgi:hypothetical protein